MMDEPKVFLSVGSNLGDRQGNLRAALGGLGPDVRTLAVSSLYETAPVGVTDQPAFLNLTVMADTVLTPDDLLTHLKSIEREVGRTKTYRWGPRIVDIDIIFYGDVALQTPSLTIPHPEMTGRAFVLIPLREIAPDFVHPVLKRTVRDLAGAISAGGVRRAAWS